MNWYMTSSVAEGPDTDVEHRTTEARCLECVMTLSLDDDQSKLGTVHWEVVSSATLKLGTAVRFTCPNGHSSDDDPQLLKAFHSRRF